MSILGSSAESARGSAARRGVRTSIGFTIAIWFSVVFYFAKRDAFATAPNTPPLRLLLALLLPIGCFWLVLGLSRPFAELVRHVDLRLLTGIQAWRFGGFAFLALYAAGLLPGFFAWPAALGDMTIGLTAPWLVLALMRDGRFVASKTFAAWNIFGVLDLVVAISMGAVAPRIFLYLGQTVTAKMVTTAPMVHLPLVLVPTFLVPLFICLHSVALLQRRTFRSATVNA